jgi:hypothetical protein
MQPALVLGLYIGAALTVVMLTALVLANRVPALEAYAFERNAACYALFVMLVLAPVVRYINRPVKMFVASMTSWILLTAAYNFAGMYFHSLFDVLQRTPLEVLAEGGIVFGVLAVASWVCRMILHARRHAHAMEEAAHTSSGALSHNR